MFSTTFLKRSDYEGKIQKDNLGIVISNDPSLLDSAELEAQQEVISYLKKRFNVALLFPKVPTWDKVTAYTIGQLIFVTADDYIATAIYSADDLINFNSEVWQANATTVAGEDPLTTPAKWDKVGVNLSFYSVILNTTAGDRPDAEPTKFLKDLNQTDQEQHNDQILNVIGDIVVKDGQYYQNIQDTTFFNTKVVTDRSDGNKTTLKIAEPVNDSAFWTPLSTRQPLIVRYCIDIVLYELHSRINPRNIPEFRIQRRDDAIEWLKMVSNPRHDITPEFPLRLHEYRKGNDITWNSNPKIDQGQRSY